jgi:hypothetical protein
MRSLILGCLTIGLTGSFLAVGCGDDTGSGGSADTTATTGATDVTKTTSPSSSSGNGQCTEITPEDFVRAVFGYAYATPMIGGAEVDSFNLEFYPEEEGGPLPTGMIDLAMGGNANYGTCTTCVLLIQDLADDGSAVKYFFQQSGTMDLGTTSFPAITGSITDVTLVEVTIEEGTFTTTPVAGGECYHVASAQFAFAEPPAEWTCDPLYYDDKVDCDCEDCGVADTDCTAMLPPIDCAEGQTCDTTALVCAGTPTAWTCDPSQYDGGVGNGCDCGCGTSDPDCDLMPAEPIEGCAGGETCNGASACVPAAWTCDVDYYDTGLAGDCDCGCAVLDPDCADATEASCDYCTDIGSCAESAADCASAPINATNNAICD